MQLGRELINLHSKIRMCPECGNYTDQELCFICLNPKRDHSVLCVVEQSQDLFTIEAASIFRGLYHVLQGVLSPIDGMGPQELRLEKLLERVENLDIREVIVATNPTLEGDSTALLIKQSLQGMDVKVSRIASGIAVGGDFEYADRLSIARSMEGRHSIN